jgi:hypothetical protein
MNNLSLAPSLDSFLKVHRLTMASFDGLSADAALRLADLDDRSLERVGDAHRDRALTVRGALLERLGRAERPREGPRTWPRAASFARGRQSG